MEAGISFNKEWAKKKTRAEFVKHFAKVYPKLDLKRIYTEITKKK
jgi:hypothetical protein